MKTIVYNSNGCKNPPLEGREAFYEPIVDYDDYITCNPQNKNGQSLFGDLLQFLNDPTSLTNQKQTSILQKEDYKLYPIPSAGTITIEYNFLGDEDAIMQINDILGRQVETILLLNANNKVSFSVLNIPNGIYTYKIKIGKETKTGKIQILK